MSRQQACTPKTHDQLNKFNPFDFFAGKSYQDWKWHRERFEATATVASTTAWDAP